MPDPYVFPPGDQRADDPVRPGAAPLGGEGGSNEHGESDVSVGTTLGGAQGGGYQKTAAGVQPGMDPELAKNVLVTAPTITSFTPATGTLNTPITVTGTNLDDVTAVNVNGTLATLVSAAPTTVVFTIGTAAGKGSTGKIELRTKDGSVQSATNLTVT